MEAENEVPQQIETTTVVEVVPQENIEPLPEPIPEPIPEPVPVSEPQEPEQPEPVVVQEPSVQQSEQITEESVTEKPGNGAAGDVVNNDISEQNQFEVEKVDLAESEVVDLETNDDVEEEKTALCAASQCGEYWLERHNKMGPTLLGVQAWPRLFGSFVLEYYFDGVVLRVRE